MKGQDAFIIKVLCVLLIVNIILVGYTSPTFKYRAEGYVGSMAAEKTPNIPSFIPQLGCGNNCGASATNVKSSAAAGLGASRS